MGPVESCSTPPGSDDGVADVRCPWCGSQRVERVAAFGPQLMSEQYICLGCRSPFERIRNR
ncbi:MAG: PaaD-like zinc ribbon domain-containing protein [Armatimonadota bacterium]